MTSRHGYLIDMDGVIYRGGELIPGADLFINRLIERDIPFLFITNNSQRMQRDVVIKLRRLGVQAEEEHVFTCAEATARYLSQQKPNGTAYVIGEGGLLTSLHEQGFAIVDKDPDFVVIGEGRTFNAETVEQALNLLLGGARFVATNLDANCPTQNGSRPGCGALVAMLEEASGLKAFSVGKPNPIMMRGARKALGLQASETIMIGDTMETDIIGGVQLGYYTIAVLTGTSTRHSINRFAYQPNEILESIAQVDDSVLVDKLRSRAKDEAIYDSEILTPRSSLAVDREPLALPTH